MGRCCDTKRSKRKRWFWALLLAVTLWHALALETEDWTVTSSRLPQGFDGMRVTLLTDVHGARYGKDNHRLVEAVAASGPDIIAISGDFVDEFTNPETMYALLDRLVEIAPVYYVTGNHEWARDDTEQVLSRLEEHGARVLRNEYEILERNGDQIVLLGLHDKNAYADMKTPQECMEQVRREQGEDAYVLALFHRNDRLQMWSELEADTVLAGHGHGGLIRLPVIGGLLGVDRELFPDDCEGLYTQGRTTLVVSRGAGGVRLWNRPHIPTVVLRREEP